MGWLQGIGKNQKGTVVVLVATMISFFIGMCALVVDLGILYLNRVELVNAIDAAALAGAQDLPDNMEAAKAAVARYALANGQANVTPSVSADGRELVVNAVATREVPLFFARIFGLHTANVSATATVHMYAVSGIKNLSIVPWGIHWGNNITYGTPLTLKHGAYGTTGGTEVAYGPLSLGGTGASIYKNNIMHGYAATIKIGDIIPADSTANISGPTSEGVQYRISQDPSATFATVSSHSARIVVVPVIDDSFRVQGFAAVFLEGVAGQGVNNIVTGRFMQMVIPSDTDGTGSLTADYGVYTAKLIK